MDRFSVAAMISLPVIVGLVAFFCGASGATDAETPRQLIQTHNPGDIAVMGDGYLLAVDAEEKQYLVRSCEIGEDENGRLCAICGDKLLAISPSITVTSGSGSLVISTGGRVRYLPRDVNAGGLVEIGELCVVAGRQNARLREVSPGIFETNRVESCGSAGDQVQLYIFQGWLDKDVAEHRPPPNRAPERRWFSGRR